MHIENSIPTDKCSGLQIGIASPERILSWSSGEVTSKDIINLKKGSFYPTGLGSEKIFGTTKDYSCSCGRYAGLNYRCRICPTCGITVESSAVRRERMGHIILQMPLLHPWFKTEVAHLLSLKESELTSVIQMKKGLQLEDAENRGLICDIGTPGSGVGGKALRELLQDFDFDRYDAHKNALSAAGLKEPTCCSYCKDLYNIYHDGYPHHFDVNTNDVLVNSKLWTSLVSLVDKCLLTMTVVVSEANKFKLIDKIFDKVTSAKDTILFLTPEEKNLLRVYIQNKFEEKQSNCCLNCKHCKALKKKNPDMPELLDNMSYYLEDLKEKYLTSTSATYKATIYKKLLLLSNLKLSKQKPEWLVFTVLPVMPADIRPSMLMGFGKNTRVGINDITTLYADLIIANQRFSELKTAPSIIRNAEYLCLQIALNRLINNEKEKTPPPKMIRKQRPCKSITGILGSKRGIFRMNLLGKRVDYSGRSVISVRPELKMYQCGLPKEMALELFRPFLIHELVQKLKMTYKQASTCLQNVNKPNYVHSNAIWDLLASVIKDHPVLLNRAPTLHRLSIQAFEAILIEGRAIGFPPLTCTPFNADFDGDQMAVHVPLSIEAQTEVKMLLMTNKNLLKPADGKPVIVPSQDMVLGSYYLTADKIGEIGEGKAFRDRAELEMAYAHRLVTLHSKVKVRIEKEIEGVKYSKIVNVSLGQLIFNDSIPQNLGYVVRDAEHMLDLEVSFQTGKSELSEIVGRSIEINGTEVTAEMLDAIKSNGFHYATKAGFTIAVSDAVIPKEKKTLLSTAENTVSEINDFYNDGYLSKSEKLHFIINTWNKTTDDVTTALKKSFEPDNPVWMMADSGARGSISQLRQLAGMRGLIANTSGKTIEIPVKSCYREGLNVLEYFISAKGARKGFADTALRTADSGYLTRRLVDVSQTITITENDCNDTDGFEISTIYSGQEIIESLSERLTGRYLLNTVKLSDGTVIANDHYLNTFEAKKIEFDGIKSIKIRSALTCKCKKGVCSKCYGKDLGRNIPVNIGEAVGIIAAQSIGEPGTQLTMRTFHTGGVASVEDITQGLPRVEELFEARPPKNPAVLAGLAGIVHLIEDDGLLCVEITDPNNASVKHKIFDSHRLLVKEGQAVLKGDALTQGAYNPKELLKLQGVTVTQNYLIKEVQKSYRQQGVDVNDKHIEILLLNMFSHVEIQDSGASSYLPNQKVLAADVISHNTAADDAVTYNYLLSGASQSSISCESWLSAASFQNTMQVLKSSAIQGKVDTLQELKPSVISGKLIQVGTGLVDPESICIKSTEAPVEDTSWRDISIKDF